MLVSCTTCTKQAGLLFLFLDQQDRAMPNFLIQFLTFLRREIRLQFRLSRSLLLDQFLVLLAGGTLGALRKEVSKLYMKLKIISPMATDEPLNTTACYFLFWLNRFLVCSYDVLKTANLQRLGKINIRNEYMQTMYLSTSPISMSW